MKNKKRKEENTRKLFNPTWWIHSPSSTGHGEDYQVQLAVGQCPRSCIHYVTPAQKIILEELLDRYKLSIISKFPIVSFFFFFYGVNHVPVSLLFFFSILDMPYDTSAEAELLYSLIVKANYENNRYQRSKKNPKVSSNNVDWL